MERKKEEYYIKKGERGPKIKIFLSHKLKKIFALRPALSYFLVGEKIESQKRGGNDQNAQYISLPNVYSDLLH